VSAVPVETATVPAAPSEPAATEATEATGAVAPDGATAVPSRRERKKKATRDALQAAALDLVETRGLASVTVEDIAERADVATRTFFNHFSSKEDAVIGWDPDGVGEVLSALAAEPRSGDPVACLHRVLVEQFSARATEAEATLRRIRLVKSDPQLLSRMAAKFEEFEQGLIWAVAERTGADPAWDLAPSLTVMVALAACRAALVHWCDQAGRVPLEATLSDALRSVTPSTERLA
jgi:AcrR family transcriptional regulator